VKPKLSIMSPINTAGRSALLFVDEFGAVAIFLLRAFVQIFRIRQIPLIIQQVYYIGARSANIVMLVGLFTGMVLGLQLYYTLIKFGSAGVLGSAVSLSLVRELGPVMTAIMITARAGSSMTTEIGIQRISEQIDALSTMRIDPIRFFLADILPAWHSWDSMPALTFTAWNRVSRCRILPEALSKPLCLPSWCQRYAVFKGILHTCEKTVTVQRRSGFPRHRRWWCRVF